MDLLEQAAEFEKAKMSHMSTSDRVHASREAKRLVLAINEMYKKTQVLLNDLGGKIGLAFQIMDDVLEVSSDSATLGKSNLSDCLLYTSPSPRDRG